MHFCVKCTTVVRLIALTAVVSQSAGELVVAPLNTESKVGDPTYLNCSTNITSREIFWYHGRNYIYVGDPTGILEPYRDRFEIDSSASDGSHNLVIHSVEPGDAGEYICIDDDGLGARRSAELVVLDNDPDCQSNIQSDGVIGPNIFNVPLDEVQLTCSITYHGKISPHVEWKKVGDSSSAQDRVTSNITSNNRIIYTLNLKADISLDNSSYVCQTTRSTQNQYNCTSKSIKVFYFLEGNTIQQEVIRGKTIACVANNNTFPCTNQWYIGNYSSCPLSCDATITTHVLGKYLCRLKCNVRGTDHYFDALNATVIDATTSPPPSTSGTIVVSVLVPAVSIVLIAIVILLCMRRKEKRKRQRLKDEEKQKIERLKDEEKQKIERLKDEAIKDEGEIKENFQYMMERFNINEAQLARVRFDRSVGLQKRSKRERPSDKVVEEKIELLYEIKKESNTEEEAISGVALLDGKLFIVRKKTPKVEVYDCSTRDFNPDNQYLDVPNLVDAVDICSCQTNKCLYIMDKKEFLTPQELIKLDKGGQPIFNWQTKDNAGGYLSTTAQGNVLITVKHKNMLMEYSPDGNWVRDIKLKERIFPWHAIQMANDCYVVSHGTVFDLTHKVCLVDNEGYVQKSFGGERGSVEDRLNIPNYLSVGSNGCVMVADLGNNRVLLLNSNLEFKAKLVSQYKQEFRNPQRVCANEKRLVVVITASDPKEKMPEEADNSGEATEEDDLSTEKAGLLRKSGEKVKVSQANVPQHTEEYCTLLVLDIQELLRK